ncbi:retrovirus-related pol polyprotein from transposon TNT 1-94 [Tanacetum coccineum]
MNEALTDESWIITMQEELNQFIANDVKELVPQPKNMKLIGTKWVFRNKLDENGVVSRNKARLVAQGYNQQEGINYDEIYALVARFESIRILLAYACALNFKLFQMDVKSAFLNDFINEEGGDVAEALGLVVADWLKGGRPSAADAKQHPFGWRLADLDGLRDVGDEVGLWAVSDPLSTENRKVRRKSFRATDDVVSGEGAGN